MLDSSALIFIESIIHHSLLLAWPTCTPQRQFSLLLATSQAHTLRIAIAAISSVIVQMLGHDLRRLPKCPQGYAELDKVVGMLEEK